MLALFSRAVERDTDHWRGNITHPRHMGLSLKEQRKMKGKNKKKVTPMILNEIWKYICSDNYY